MIRSAVSVYSPELYCSLRGFAAHSQCSLRQFDGKCTANPQRLQYDSMETALQIEKNFEPVEKFLLVGDSTANALRLIANALQMRRDSEN